MRRSRFTEEETVDITEGLYYSFRNVCYMNGGDYEVSKFLKDRGINEPFATIFTRLQADGLFQNVGSKKVPNYRNFKPLYAESTRTALEWYRNQSHIRYEARKERQRKMWEFPEPVKRKFTVKVFGFTLFSISF